MKKIVLLASLLALAACSPGASENSEATAETSTAAAPTAPVIAAGVYDFTFANDWAPTVLTLNADGSYSETGSAIADKSGTWTQQDGNLCKSGDQEECWVKQEHLESGAFVVTREGVQGTLTPRAAAATQTAPVAGTLAAARELPTGTYSQSCSNAKLDGVTMSATCASMNGQQVQSTLDLTDCPIGHNVMNDNGHLACRVG